MAEYGAVTSATLTPLVQDQLEEIIEATSQLSIRNNYSVRIDDVILQSFEECPDYYPLTTKEAKQFTEILKRKGFTYSLMAAVINEHQPNFSDWRHNNRRPGIGRKVKTWLHGIFEKVLPGIAITSYSIRSCVDFYKYQ